MAEMPGFSPPTRGGSHARGEARKVGRLFPAHAGVIPALSSCS